jgi:hypothetical protein
MRTRTALLAVVSALLLSCGPTTPPVAPQVTVAPNLTVLSTVATNSATVLPDSLRFPAAGNEALLGHVPGDLLAGGPDSPNAFLRRVQAVRREGDSVVIDTEQAAFQDAIVNGSFAVTVQPLGLGPMGPLASSQLVGPGGTVTPYDSGGLLGGHLDITQTMLTAQCLPGWECAVDGGGDFWLEVESGYLDFSPKIDLGATVEWGQLKEFHYVGSETIAGELMLSLHTKGKVIGRIETLSTAPLWRSPPGFFTAMAGPLPVVFETGYGIGIGCEVEAQGTAVTTFGAGAREHQAFGVKWNSMDGWQGVGDQTFNMWGSWPSAAPGSAKVQFRCFFKITYDLLVYAAAGPEVAIKAPYLEYSYEPWASPSPHWQINIGAKATVTPATLQLGPFRLDSPSIKVFDLTAPLTQGDYPAFVPDPCAGAASTDFCGGETALGFDGHGTPGDRYVCSQGTTVLSIHCTYGCVQSSVPGSRTMCQQPITNACSVAANDLYCGGETVNGFAGPTFGFNNAKLLTCLDGQVVGQETCTFGCGPASAFLQANGIRVACQPPPPPVANPCMYAADGDYCGESVTKDNFGSGVPGHLYTCRGAAVVRDVVCDAGCAQHPSPTPDACNPPPPPPDPCNGVPGYGYFCGESTQYGFNARGVAGTLYLCSSGVTASQTACGFGCIVNPPGTDDACRGDPCNGIPGYGYFCGESTQYGFNARGVAGTLYLCSSGTTASQTVCSDGCVVNPPGVDDACRTPTPPDQCSGANNGAYCGTDPKTGFAGGLDPNALYTCSGGRIVAQQACSAGCVATSSGAPDYCATPPPPPQGCGTLVCGTTCCPDPASWCSPTYANKCCTTCGVGCPNC